MKKKSYLWMLPACLVFCILPFCMGLQIIDIDLFQYPWFPNQKIWGDFFLFKRSKMVVWIAVFTLLILLDAFFLQRKRIKIHKKWFLLLGYMAFCMISAICSDKRELAFQGGMEHFEGLWVLLAYGIICFYGYYVAKSNENCGFVFHLVVVSCFLLSVIGMMQLLGMDLLQTDGVLSLLIPEKFKEYRNQVSFNFQQEGMNLVYMTLYNPNYVGSFVALCFPILLGVFGWTKHRGMKIWVAGTYVLLMICLVGSQSKTGILVCIFIHLLIAFLWISLRLTEKNVEKRTHVSQQWKAIEKNHVVNRYIIWSLEIVVLLSFLSASIFGVWKAKKELDTRFEQITLQQTGIEVKYNNVLLHIDYRLEENKVVPVFQDENGLEPACEYDVEKEEYLIQVENLRDLRVGCYEEEGFVHIYLSNEKNQWLFVDEKGNHQMSYVTIYGKTDQLVEAPSVFPKNFDSLFTYRGYIWGRTIPLLKDKLLWGSGPDTFIYEFPQNDYVSRSHGEQGFFREILTKPHSMYLQMAVQTGVGSLLCLMLFVGHTLIKAMVLIGKRTSQKKMQQQDEQMAVLMYSILGYMLVGIFNDSTVTVAPVFFLFCGLLTGSVERGEE